MLLAIFACWRSGATRSATAVSPKIPQAWRNAIFCVAIFSAAVWMAACSGSGADPPAATTPGTPAGSYAITVSGTSTNTSGQITLSLTVQ